MGELVYQDSVTTLRDAVKQISFICFFKCSDLCSWFVSCQSCGSVPQQQCPSSLGDRKSKQRELSIRQPILFYNKLVDICKQFISNFDNTVDVSSRFRRQVRFLFFPVEVLHQMTEIMTHRSRNTAYRQRLFQPSCVGLAKMLMLLINVVSWIVNHLEATDTLRAPLKSTLHHEPAALQWRDEWSRACFPAGSVTAQKRH